MSSPAILSTGKDTWRTPPELLHALDAEFGFAVDLAASDDAVAFPGRLHVPPEAGPQGSLGVNWSAWCARTDRWRQWPRLVGFLNPPYSTKGGLGRGLLAWHEKAWEESRNGWTTVLLCPPRPGVTWFWRYALRADEVRYFAQRLEFVDPDPATKKRRGNTQASCLVIYRPHVPLAGWVGGPRQSWWHRVPRRPVWRCEQDGRTMPPRWTPPAEIEEVSP